MVTLSTKELGTIREADSFISYNTFLFLIFFLIESCAGLFVDMATLSKIFIGAVAMAYLTSKRLTVANQTHFKIDTDIATRRMCGFPLTEKDSQSAMTVTTWWEFTKEAVTVSIASNSLNVARWTYR